MSPDTFARWKAGKLLAQSVLISTDTLTITETRKDRDTGLVVVATFSCEDLLTLTRGRER